MRNFHFLFLILAGSICILGCVGDQSVEQPTASTNTNQTDTFAARAPKTNVCHFDAFGSRVIVVSDPSLLPAHFSHGDCTTNLPKGTKDCGCTSITIIKNAFPDVATSFGFSASGGITQNFSLTDNGVVGPDRITFSNVGSSSVTITETSQATDYDLTGISCSITGSGGSQTSPNVPLGTVAITPASGDQITCTFVNSFVAPLDCTGKPDGYPCEDGNLCTEVGSCQSQVCVPGPNLCG